MVVHILNGDALAGTFKSSTIHGEVIVCRECLIDGPVSSDNEVDFWNERSGFILQDFEGPPSEYFETVKSEFDKINVLSPDDDVFLWFEHDLFCQANMWFIISMLHKHQLTKAYRISPLPKLNMKWEGFGHHTPEDLKSCLSNRVALSPADFKLGADLWDSYRKNDTKTLQFLGGTLSPCFPRLDEVCRAELERKQHARPKKVLREIMAKGHSEFKDIFTQFSQREGIYGFGDLQVNQMLKDLRGR